MKSLWDGFTKKDDIITGKDSLETSVTTTGREKITPPKKYNDDAFKTLKKMFEKENAKSYKQADTVTVSINDNDRLFKSKYETDDAYDALFEI